MTATKHTPGPWDWTWDGEGQPGRVAKTLPCEPVEDCGYDSVCIALTYDQRGRFDQRANAQLIAAAPELLEEHQQWAEWFGEALVLALQSDYSKVDELARTFRLSFATGSAVIKSDAIAKATGSPA